MMLRKMPIISLLIWSHNEDVLLLKARVLKAQEKTKEAEQVYGMVIEVNPFSLDAYRERSEVRTILGDAAGAAEDEASIKEMSRSSNHQKE